MASPHRGTAAEAATASPTNLKSIFSKASGVASPGGTIGVTLNAGSNDHLDIVHGGAHQRFAIIRDFIASHGDRNVHFSGEAFEMLHSLPVKRFIIVTENALYRVAQTTVDTGIFFDCRLSLDELAQLISQDVADDAGRGITGGAEVQLYTKAPGTGKNKHSDPLDSPLRRHATEVQLLATLNFARDTPRRKAFLLSVCVVRPTLSILQKRSVVASTAPADATSGQRSTNATVSSPHAAAGAGRGQLPRFATMTQSARVRRDSIASSAGSKAQQPTTPSAAGGTTARTAATAVSPSVQPAASTAAGAGGVSPVYSPPLFRSESPSVGATAGRSRPQLDVSDDDFLRAQQSLRESLTAATTEGTADGAPGAYDYEVAASRPKEEAMDRTLERERIKAMLISREAQLVQNIEFKVKYPQKVPTRVPPGVEYDKAHEERRALPEDFPDSDLLGPSLFPLWLQWKKCGGLLAEDGMPSEHWSLYDSDDLIESLKAREDVLYGHIGKKPQRRLMEMRELVERERQMFKNKLNMIKVVAQIHGVEDGDEQDDDDDGYGNEYGSASGNNYNESGSPGSARGPKSQARSRKSGTIDHSNKGRIASNKYTKIKPFQLSKSVSSTQRLKLLDTKHLLGEMKHNFENHLKTIYALKKEQLQTELNRAAGGEESP